MDSVKTSVLGFSRDTEPAGVHRYTERNQLLGVGSRDSRGSINPKCAGALAAQRPGEKGSPESTGGLLKSSVLRGQPVPPGPSVDGQRPLVSVRWGRCNNVPHTNGFWTMEMYRPRLLEVLGLGPQLCASARGTLTWHKGQGGSLGLFDKRTRAIPESPPEGPMS